MFNCVCVASRCVFAFAFMAAAGGTANAADLGDYNRSYKDYGDPIVVPPDHFSWTGFYLGAHLGYGWGSSSSVNRPGAGNGDAFDGADGIDIEPDGWLGGVTLGYNWQTDAFVFGVESDLGYMGARDSRRTAIAFGTAEYGGYGTLAARLGYADDRWMFYAKGGFAFADIENRAGAAFGGVTEPLDATRLREIRAGWTLGGGVEFAFRPDISMKLEYLYMDFADDSSGNLDGDVFRHENDIHTLKVGLNYSLQRDFEPLR